MRALKKAVNHELAANDIGKLGEVTRSRDQRMADGKALRDKVSRTSHAVWKKPAKSRDPIAILKASNRGRLVPPQNLVHADWLVISKSGR